MPCSGAAYRRRRFGHTLWDVHRSVAEFRKYVELRDEDGLAAAFKAMDRLKCWRECIEQFTQDRVPQESVGAALLSFWNNYGIWRIGRSLRADLPIFVDALKFHLAQYTGPSLTLYRGELETRYRSGINGFAWTSHVEVAETFARRRNPGPGGRSNKDEGPGVVLRLDASSEMIIAGPTEHSRRLQEFEFIVDPRLIRTVEIVARFPVPPYGGAPATRNKSTHERG